MGCMIIFTTNIGPRKKMQVLCLNLSVVTLYHSNGRKQREAKEPLDESEKAGLKLNIKKIKIMVSGPITSWQIEGGNMEVVTDFLFLGSKITADGDCNHEIRR